MNESFGILILAGGESMRMDFPKIYLKIDGKTFLSKIVTEYCSAGIENICLVINEKFVSGRWKKLFEQAKLRVGVIEKTEPHYGRFHSLKLGIKNLLACDFVFVQNGDNPLINKDTIERMMQNKNPLGYTQVAFNGKSGHPVMISKNISLRINEIKVTNYNLRNILKEFPKTEVEVNDEGILANINTKEDFEKYLYGKHEKYF